MEVVVRPVLLNDAADLAKLLRKIGWFKDVGSQSESETLEQVTNHLTQITSSDSHTQLVVIHPEQGLVGYVAMHWIPYLFMTGPEGFVSELFIDESARGLGIGTHLLNTIEREAIAKRCGRLQLVNFRHRESYERKFYEKNGWEERPLAANFVKKLSL